MQNAEHRRGHMCPGMRRDRALATNNSQLPRIQAGA